jgi:hypothetical protein
MVGMFRHWDLAFYQPASPVEIKPLSPNSSASILGLTLDGFRPIPEPTAVPIDLNRLIGGVHTA